MCPETVLFRQKCTFWFRRDLFFSVGYGVGTLCVFSWTDSGRTRGSCPRSPEEGLAWLEVSTVSTSRPPAHGLFALLRVHVVVRTPPFRDCDGHLTVVVTQFEDRWFYVGA